MKNIYKVARGTMMAIIVAPIALYVVLYIALSLPFIQNLVRERAEKELSAFFGTKAEIGRLDIHPFNRVAVSDLSLPSPDGKKCIAVKRLGAGIDLWQLISDGNLVFTHAEIMGLDSDIRQQAPDSPLNIDFIIKAFAPKDKNKPPTRFDFRVHNVIIRQSKLAFTREWMPEKNNGQIDFNRLSISDLRADIELPRMKNDDFNIHISRLTFKEKNGFVLESLKGEFHVSPTLLRANGVEIKLPGSLLKLNNQELHISGYGDIAEAIKNEDLSLDIVSARITPSDFSAFVPDLSRYADPFYINLSADGNLNHITLKNLSLSSGKSSVSLETSGELTNLGDKNSFSVILPSLKFTANRNDVAFFSSLAPSLPENVKAIISRVGEIDLDTRLFLTAQSLDVSGKLFSSLGLLHLDSRIDFAPGSPLHIAGKAASPDFSLGALIANSNLGNLAFDASADFNIGKGDVYGTLHASVPFIEAAEKKWTDINVSLTKQGGKVSGDFSIEDQALTLSGNGEMLHAGTNSSLNIGINCNQADFRLLPVPTSLRNMLLSGNINANLSGNSASTLQGEIMLGDINISRDGKPLHIGDISISMVQNDISQLTLNSKFISGNISGRFNLASIPRVVKLAAASAFPSTVPFNGHHGTESFDYHFTIPADNTLSDYFRLPVKMLSDIELTGRIDESSRFYSLAVDAPYLQKGKDKLISDTRLRLTSDADTDGCNLFVTSLLPGKNCDIRVNLNAHAADDNINAGISWKADRTKDYSGDINLCALLSRTHNGKGLDASVSLLPSLFTINDTVWQINPAKIIYAGKAVDISGIKINNNTQHVSIDGRASALTGDSVSVTLRNMDLDYIFETLNINYVTFGGRATGEVTATDIFTPHPVAFTDNLKVDNLTYNGGRLGDAMISSRWNNFAKSVEIRADIADEGHRAAFVDGAVFVTRDSLGFSLDADKVNIKFLQPFLQAFSSEVKGRASGKANLFGTFSDIDLTGRIFADTILMKLDYTNTWYGGSDSVILDPGHISIPGFRLYDKFGNRALFSGEVTHRYFHEPAFNFRVTDARNFLCYNTDASINPDWFGTIFGNGGASITGHPGIVDILVEMTTAPGSRFNLILNDLESAADYKFLTFSDSRKEKEEALRPDTVPEIVKMFRKRVAAQQQEMASAFNIDLRASVTPDAEAVIVMDPVGGDRIRAFGSGGLQIGYNSRTDRMTMYGKYTLEKGKYNFTLQDIFLKDFIIRPGSSISFNGDPFNALLNIDAAYRVNTNLSDLDRSFSTDRDLNRTSVPVEAILRVTGQLQSPDIDFDIELPTLTQEVERKVKSIISTEDMMNRQIIYLLALNRFYTPEYMGNSGNGGEFTSLASSTISSQISNMLANLTDKWTISPNFRTDNGTFSDLELDLNLSSRLLNNRLLINGNLGYRDRSTSSTTFIGDFDLEYLLNRRGNLRLKAYNHFNDKNYYLKSSLTTQGVGILYKHDFDRWFPFLKRRHRNNVEKDSTDSK